MAVEEIDRRLEDRFALLRGGDRSAPDRHQTLLAVIDWSWNLLDEDERRALRRLALFNDGFTLDGGGRGARRRRARRGPGPRRPVAAERPRDAAGGLRYRMLETVREFGRLQLVRGRRGRRGARGPPRAGRPRTPAATARGLIGPRAVRGDRRRRRRGDQPRRRAARRDRRRRPRRARRAARRARALLDDPRRARPPARPARRDRRRGRRLARRRRSSRTPPGPRWRSRSATR